MVGKNPYTEDLPVSAIRTIVVYKTPKILRRGAKLCPGNADSMIALESAEWLDIQRNFLFWTRPKNSLLEKGVKQRARCQVVLHG